MINKLLTYLLKNKEIKKGRNVNLNKLSYIKNSEFLGNNYVDRFCRIRNTQLGNYSYIGYNSHLNNVRIGNYCSISSDVKIGLGTHPIHLFSTSPVFYSDNNPFNLKINKTHYNDNPKLTIIKNDVWIGSNVIIMDGVKVGNGAIIAAGSVVTKDISNYEIVGGVPAKLINKRFDEDTIKKLNASKWWENDARKLIELEFDI
ncbi:acetyltransferase [Staphylococcus equorum]|uniref:xenobiotic acyltransferase family protein n=1 Tax=Staphylococcus equorum TaxID=246432 RepID=UPI0009C02A87|nr:CatB-related O-acetyltransferase [Staphylococcus equorum]PTE24806.1 acetyltransferase [Staphylococcus equorum]PTF06727.1 acetyltransferase [Staphylococcus equorum]